jgi:hypothetical protein
MKAVILILLATPGFAAELSQATLQEFNAYMRSADREMTERASHSLHIIRGLAASSRLKNGEVVVRTWHNEPTVDVKDGLIHDWVGTFFVPGGTVNDALEVIRGVEHHAKIYAPDTVRAGVISRSTDTTKSTMRTSKKKVLTVTLDYVFEGKWYTISEKSARGAIRSISVREVENAGAANEKVLPDGQGWGWLWRLNSYWSIAERDGGVYAEMRSVSLTRNIPLGLSTLMKPYITGVPRETLEQTLAKTKDAIAAKAASR